MEPLAIIIAIIIIAAITAAYEIWVNSDTVITITDLITRTFLGQPVDDLELSLHPSLTAGMLCLPLTADDLARVHACTAVKRKKVTVDLHHPMKMLLGMADLAVTYDFEGTSPAGETITVQDGAYLRVYFDDVRSRYGTRSLTLTKVDFWHPTEKEKRK